jgi:hypothetical protein
MTTKDIDLFIDNKTYKTLLNKHGQIIGERKKGQMHVYMGTKKPYHK